MAGVLAEAVAESQPLREAPAGTARFVTNKGTGVTHRVAPGWDATQPRATWRAACGWAFAGDGALLLATLPPGPWCGRHGCFREGPPVAEVESGSSEG